MACPFFVPTHKADDLAWLHPARLPLGAGWRGNCGAPGYEGVAPSADELTEKCNLGYAVNCPRLPKERAHDAIRFSVLKDSGSTLTLWFVFESAHLPAGHGTLEYQVSERRWISGHPNPGIQNMANCFVESYLARKAAPIEQLDSSTGQNINRADW